MSFTNACFFIFLLFHKISIFIRFLLLFYNVPALFLLISFLPIRYALCAGLIDRDHLMATVEERRELYYDKNYIAELHTILPMYLHLGYLQ